MILINLIVSDVPKHLIATDCLDTVVRMEYGPELADPLVDVRDVVESFRSYGVTPPDWRATLGNAAAALDELSPGPQLSDLLPPLVLHLNELLVGGLAENPVVVSEVAEEVSAVLASVPLPTMPKPTDRNWEFDRF
jgi:hypothetical protein